MLRIVNLILVLAVLTTQSAWAISDTALYDANAGHQEQTLTQTAEQHDDTADACSHLCHAGAHLVGIFSNININIPVTNNSHTSKLKQLASSVKYQPPTPPPTL